MFHEEMICTESEMCMPKTRCNIFISATVVYMSYDMFIHIQIYIIYSTYIMMVHVKIDKRISKQNSREWWLKLILYQRKGP